MNSIVVSIVGVLLCTGPLWGMALGYTLAIRGYRIRTPFHRDHDEE